MNLLFLLGNVEKGLAQSDDSLEQLIGDAHVLEIQEADFHQGMAKLLQELRLGSRVIGRSEIQDGDGRKGHC